MIAMIWATASDGVGTEALVSGRSGDPIVFVHGVGSTAEIWEPQLLGLGDTHRCFAVELRGNGAGPDPGPEQITREGYARDVLAIADKAGLEGFHFVGCSLGGVVAFELWKHHPDRIISFTLAGSFARYPDGQKYASGVAAAARAAGSMQVFARERAGKLGLPPNRLAETIEQMAAKSLPSYIAATQATWTGDYRDLLPTISVPTLVISGARDTLVPLELSREIANAVPGARLVVLEDAGHVSNADDPAGFNELLSRFLSNVR
jgi:3-oxoadipate enol-lactonase